MKASIVSEFGIVLICTLSSNNSVWKREVVKPHFIKPSYNEKSLVHYLPKILDLKNSDFKIYFWTFNFWTLGTHFGQISDKNFGNFAET